MHGHGNQEDEEVSGHEKGFHRQRAVDKERAVGHTKAHRGTGDADEERIGGDAGIALRHWPYTPNIPLIHSTICGAPKMAAMQTITTIAVPQVTLPAKPAIATPMT